MSEEINILYVDDELNNLVGFKSSFRFDYKIFTAINTSEAIDHLEKNPDIRIVFCDQRMPDKTGVEFFEEIRIKYPLPIRILITGYTDIEALIDAINRGNIFRYVKKPWDSVDILSAVEEANKMYMAYSMLAIKNEELQKAYNELDKFAYSVTHDIRGPLSGILGTINLTDNLHSIVEMKEMLFLMKNSVNKLNDFILNMHDYYSLKRGKLQITEINFNTVVEDIKTFYKMYKTSANIQFTTSINQSEAFYSDEMSLKIILNNLLSNAFKYQKKENDNKQVDLNIQVMDGIATITVTDNGIGIQAQYIDKIFNLFFRATSKEAGSGFGLYNLKDALSKLNGEIKVNTVLGEGTKFNVTIPNK